MHVLYEHFSNWINSFGRNHHGIWTTTFCRKLNLGQKLAIQFFNFRISLGFSPGDRNLVNCDRDRPVKMQHYQIIISHGVVNNIGKVILVVTNIIISLLSYINYYAFSYDINKNWTKKILLFSWYIQKHFGDSEECS